MGASQSTRKISVDNDDQANVIKISDTLVDRLRGSTQISGERETSTAPKPYVERSGQHGPPEIYAYPSLTSLEVKKEKEQELNDADQYWKQRLQDLDESHKKIDHVMEKEFQKAVSDVSEIFQKLPARPAQPPCLDGKQRVIQCYKDNIKRPMACAAEVEAFAQCVDLNRANVISNQG